MRIHLVAVGRLKSGPERELAARYEARIGEIGRGCGISGLRLHELPESAARRPADRQAEEARAILAVLPDRAQVFAFDEGGATPTSEAFAAEIATAAAGAPDLALIIGGPDGLDAALKAGADRVFAFGRMTMPHQLVRVLLLEQLYRSCTILINHPYHRR